MTERLDVPTIIRRKQSGEQWHLLAREVGVRMGVLKAACVAAGFRLPCPAAKRSKRTSPPAAPVQGPVTIPAFDRDDSAATNLLAKYRPRTLSEVLGQADVVASLSAFVQAPYPTAMLFHGDSGVGKTSAAYALARDLGCAVEEAELGGVMEIASGSQTADTVRKVLDLLRYRPLCGSGWRVLMVNECDRMALPVETIWLDALEHLPGQTVVVFTTNDPGRLSDRFRHRCEPYHFKGGSDHLRPWIVAFAAMIWRREVGTTPPDFTDLGMPTLGTGESMTASFRLAVQQLQQMIRAARSPCR